MEERNHRQPTERPRSQQASIAKRQRPRNERATHTECSQRNRCPEGNHSLYPRMRCPTRQPEKSGGGSCNPEARPRRACTTARRHRLERMPQNDCSRPRRIACLCAERMETEHHNRPNRLVVMILPTQNTTAERQALAGLIGGRNHSHCNRRLLLSFPSLDSSFFMHTTPAASDHTFKRTRNPNALSTKISPNLGMQPQTAAADTLIHHSP